jgi:phospholipase/carboxylesterase
MLGRIKIWQPEGTPQGSIIFLHGFGDSLRLWMPLAQKLALPYPVRMLFPEAPRVFAPHVGKLKRAWFTPAGHDFMQGPASSTEQSIATIADLIKEEQNLGIPPQKIILIGFSQGGSLALLVALREAVGGAAAVAAFLRAEEIEQAAHLTSPTLLMLHGAKDQIVPADLGFQTTKGLQDKGLDVRWRLYPDLGHEMNEQWLEALRAWLLDILAS